MSTSVDVSSLVAEISSSLTDRLSENVDRRTIEERDTIGALGHVNKSIWRILQRNRSREEDMRECVDAMAYLALVYYLRKNPYGNSIPSSFFLRGRKQEGE